MNRDLVDLNPIFETSSFVDASKKIEEHSEGKLIDPPVSETIIYGSSGDVTLVQPKSIWVFYAKNDSSEDSLITARSTGGFKYRLSGADHKYRDLFSNVYTASFSVPKGSQLYIIIDSREDLLFSLDNATLPGTLLPSFRSIANAFSFFALGCAATIFYVGFIFKLFPLVIVSIMQFAMVLSAYVHSSLPFEYLGYHNSQLILVLASISVAIMLLLFMLSSLEKKETFCKKATLALLSLTVCTMPVPFLSDSKIINSMIATIVPALSVTLTLGVSIKRLANKTHRVYSKAIIIYGISQVVTVCLYYATTYSGGISSALGSKELMLLNSFAAPLFLAIPVVSATKDVQESLRTEYITQDLSRQFHSYVKALCHLISNRVQQMIFYHENVLLLSKDILQKLTIATPSIALDEESMAIVSLRLDKIRQVQEESEKQVLATLRLVQSTRGMSAAAIEGLGQLYKELDINVLLNRVCKDIDLRGASGNARIEFWSEEETSLCYADRYGFLELIIKNILSNARRYSLPGTSVRIFSYTESSLIRIAFLNTGASLITEKDLGNLFREVELEPILGEDNSWTSLSKKNVADIPAQESDYIKKLMIGIENNTNSPSMSFVMRHGLSQGINLSLSREVLRSLAGELTAHSGHLPDDEQDVHSGLSRHILGSFSFGAVLTLRSASSFRSPPFSADERMEAKNTNPKPIPVSAKRHSIVYEIESLGSKLSAKNDFNDNSTDCGNGLEGLRVKSARDARRQRKVG